VMSAAWIRAALPKYRDLAIDEPTYDNVAGYLALQRVAAERSQAFADTASYVSVSTPLLDEGARRPNNTFGANAATAAAERNTRRVLTELSKTVGIWYFFRSDCEFCEKQGPLLESLARNYGFTIIPISMDGGPPPSGKFDYMQIDSGQSQRLGVTVTPSLFLVRPGSNEVIPFAHGLQAAPQLVERIISAAHFAGWISDEAAVTTRPFAPQSPELLDPDYSIERLRPLVEKLSDRVVMTDDDFKQSYAASIGMGGTNAP
jgi:conjugal transfer pilus assembly protein TraF